jgi:hypothetical protein
MPRVSGLSRARDAILAFFDDSRVRVFRLNDLSRILHVQRHEWKLPKSVTTPAFVRYLRQHAFLDRIRLALPYRPETVYAWRQVSPYQVALGVYPHAYLTHFTAAVLHELTVQVPRVIYVNVEQRSQGGSIQPLSQERIDNAFRRPEQRMTTNVVEYEGLRFTYINGRFTGQLGVVDHVSSTGEVLRVTDLERTLIDMAVRPAYAGGVGEVASAYVNAKGRVSANRLAVLLRELEYVYPYEQVIGYYLERAGYSEEVLKLFEWNQPFKLDFYLTYGMSEVDHSSRWRLFVPKGF